MGYTQTSSGSKKYSIIFSVIVIVVIGGLYAYTKLVKSTQQSQRVVFSPGTQYVPKGAESHEVDQSLAAFGLPVTPPFFDKNNVVQSLQLGTALSSQATGSAKESSRINTTTTSSAIKQSSATFLSYRIIGHDKTTARAAFADYFKNLGWKTVKIASGDQASMIFFTSQQSITITFIEAPHAPGTDQPTIIAAMTTQNTSVSNR